MVKVKFWSDGVPIAVFCFFFSFALQKKKEEEECTSCFVLDDQCSACSIGTG